MDENSDKEQNKDDQDNQDLLKKEKSAEIVKSIRLLESVFKTSVDGRQKARVKKDLNSLRARLQEMYPDSNLVELEEAIYSDIMAVNKKKEVSLKDFEYLKEVEPEIFSAHKEDREINEIVSILKHFEERIWASLSDQHIKLDFSNSSERDTLNRKFDECNRALKTFSQTIEDIGKSRTSEYLSQLHLIRVRHGRLLLFDIYYLFKAAKKLFTDLLANHEIGGNMILNPDDPVEYESYEKYPLFKGMTVIEALVYSDKFIDAVLKYVNIPDIKQA